MKSACVSLSLCGLVFLCAGASQGQQPMGPPKVIQIIREQVKVGRGPAHVKTEAAFVNAFRKAKWPTHYLAAYAMSGPNEVWFFVGFDTFEAWEKDNQASDKNAALTAELDRATELDGTNLNDSRTVVATYRPDLSYRPDVNIGEYKYFETEVVRVRLGREEEFAALAKIEIESHERLNIEEHWAAYEVAEGMPEGTIIFFTPMKSLKEKDSSHEKQIREAMGEENWKKFDQFGRDGIIADESNLLGFSPNMSYISDQVAAADPSFWKPKAGGTATGGEMKEGGKPAAPPAKKPSGKEPAKK